MSPDDPIADTLKLSRPAHRALLHAGIVTFADLAQWSRPDVAALHGIGPKSFVELDPALAERGLGYRPA
ncbi:RNA polymerase, alpha chain C terminal domain [Devosia lucknowensis]|uniref:RNA polymerase, alpha chain C terminal domain n=1 Tax=Devosia lucknowensis TaxID=1096929 RepID=A0A1Y6FEB2_9HYPH|nr:DNA-directed RNA polymerase subunit alpha C-terminal domain-containing protein [Devosia lucknowensis]SMQ72989.1 RNA polymerase, alpha chain C terminal domain [Devosia lucknowensis]